MTSYSLSICIPTYNREKYLLVLLESILAQMEDDFRDEVEVAVSDNASNDGTVAMLEQFRIRHPHLAVGVAQENRGPDANYLRVVELASGSFCWFIGSDDILAPGSLRRVVEWARRSAADIIVSDRYESDVTLTAPLTHTTWSRLDTDYSFRTDDAAGSRRYLSECTSIGGLFSFLSAIVFRKELWEQVPAKDRFLGSAYVHTHALMEMWRRGCRFLYSKQPLVVNRQGNDFFCQSHDVESVYRRIKLDIDGYRDIPLYVFGSDSVEYALIRRVVEGQWKLGDYAHVASQMGSSRRRVFDLLEGSGHHRTASRLRLVLKPGLFFLFRAALRLQRMMGLA